MKQAGAFLYSLVLLFFAGCFAFTALASTAKAVVAVPKLVSLGAIVHSDTDDTLAFTPNGNTVFFDRSEGRHKTIMVSQQLKNSTFSAIFAEPQVLESGPRGPVGGRSFRPAHDAAG